MNNIDYSNEDVDALAVNRFIRKIRSECRATKPALSICQLLLANMKKRVSSTSSGVVRNDSTREPPLPLYLGLSIYGNSREKSQIDFLHQKGLSVSSNRIFEVTSTLAHDVVKRADADGAVCPLALKKGFFTVRALDNVDMKPSSNTSQGEFHGTGISLFQLPLNGEIGIEREVTRTFGETAVSMDHGPYLIFPRADELWYGEEDWLLHVHNQLLEKEPLFLETMSWSAFYSVRQGTSPLALANYSLLPLFHEKAASPDMVKHGLDMLKLSTDFLNPGQKTVMFLDEPLFALAKLIQWNLPEKYGDDKFVLLFGPLHIEQNFLRLIGEVMQCSGWTGVVANSGILSSGSAEGLLKVSSIVKSRNFHQYTAAALFSLLNDAYCQDHPEGDVTFEQWTNERAFVVRKTLNAFSAIGVDHAHEQNNAAVKSSGGAIGLTQDPSALRRWTIAGPEVTRLLSEFEGKKEKQPGQHHEMYTKFQRQFFERCAALKDSFLQNENPFLVKGCELLTIDTRIVISKTGIESLKNLESHGMEMLRNFVEKRLETHDVPFYDPVKKQRFQIFTHQKSVKNSPTAELKTDLQLFSRLFIRQHRKHVTGLFWMARLWCA
ncbi:30S ribosomal protein S17 [Frankliniella fusca]|uniref:30S ribosomal protein S17 n=1 Tax=Frankliniella fusca TaxID=407009 RepID=A0AAE1HY20_9NEOP|nr:30S ribosomal protein S17 [Frankliniella fusca]